MKTDCLKLRMRFVTLLSSLAAVLLLIIPASKPSASVGTPQGKGGEVIAKPTPTPVPKKTTPKKRTPASNSKISQPAKSGDSASAAEMIFWNSIKDSTNPDDFNAYLTKYPDGEYASLAKNRLRALEAAKEAANAKPNATPGEQPASTPAPTNETRSEPPNVVIPPGETKEDAKKHFDKAWKLYFPDHDLEAAQRESRIALRLDPSNASYHELLGLILYAQCKDTEAEGELKEAIRIAPSDSDYEYLSEVFEREKKYEESEAAWREIVRRGTYAGQERLAWVAHRKLGSVLAKHGKLTESESEWRESIRLTASDSLFKADAHADYGMKLYDLKRYAEAEIELREAIRLAPTDSYYHSTWHVYLGRILAAQKKWAEAEAEMREAIRVDLPKTPYYFVWEGLAKVFEDQGRLADADKAYQEGLRSIPTDPSRETENRRSYGEWLMKQKRWSEAEIQYREVIRSFKEPTAWHTSWAYAALGDALRGQNKLTEAEAEYQRALHIEAFSGGALYGLADSLEKQNRLKEAEFEYRTLVKAACGEADAHAKFGDFLSRQKKWKEAEAQYRQAVFLDSQNTEYPQKLQQTINAQKK